MENRFTVRGTLEMIRLSLGGALFGAALSGTLGGFALFGQSDRRDWIWASTGFAICFTLLVREKRKERDRRIAKSAALRPSRTGVVPRETPAPD